MEGKRFQIRSAEVRQLLAEMIGTFILMVSRVARWFVFKPKIQIWVNFGGFLQWKMLA
jgi:hypothetical protein